MEHKKHNSILKADYFKTIDTKEKAYWLGFLYADGCVKTKTRLAIELHQKDRILLESFILDINRSINSINKNSRGLLTYSVITMEMEGKGAAQYIQEADCSLRI